MAVKGRARRARDFPSLSPELEKLSDFSEEESSDGDE